MLKLTWKPFPVRGPSFTNNQTPWIVCCARTLWKFVMPALHLEHVFHDSRSYTFVFYAFGFSPSRQGWVRDPWGAEESEEATDHNHDDGGETKQGPICGNGLLFPPSNRWQTHDYMLLLPPCSLLPS